MLTALEKALAFPHHDAGWEVLGDGTDSWIVMRDNIRTRILEEDYCIYLAWFTTIYTRPSTKQQYEINFKRMVQTNTTTNKERPIRRLTQRNANSTLWSILGDGDQGWIPLDNSPATTNIDIKYQNFLDKNRTITQYTSKNKDCLEFTYRVDFDKFEQTNTSTNVTRKIRRSVPDYRWELMADENDGFIPFQNRTAQDNVEITYQAFITWNQNPSYQTATYQRNTKRGLTTYSVNFANMTQTNSTTQKNRTIRRLVPTAYTIHTSYRM